VEVNAKQDLQLPVNLHQKAGRWYHVKRDPTTRKVKWTGLSRDLGQALEQHRLLEGGKPTEAFAEPGAPGHWLSNMAALLHAQTKRRAQERDVMFTLTVDDVFRMGQASNWRCAVTGMKFSQDKGDEHSRRAFAPSIDRINCNLGYTPGNCRMVCVITNIALSDWGEGVFRQMVISYAKHHRLEIDR
jgi:hypothetical protein